MKILSVPSHGRVNTRRILLVDFAPLTAHGSVPRADQPPLDKRGYAFWQGGPILTMTQGAEVRVLLQRMNIDETAPLTLAVSGSLEPEGLAQRPSGVWTVPDGDSIELRLRAPLAPRPEQVLNVGSGRLRDVAPDPLAYQYSRVSVRWRDFVIKTLDVFAFEPIRLRIVPRLVFVSGFGTHPSMPFGQVVTAEALRVVNAVWAQAGIQFTMDPLSEIRLQRSGRVSGQFSYGADCRDMFQQGITAGAINVYLVDHDETFDAAHAAYTHRVGDTASPQPSIIVPNRANSTAGTSLWTQFDARLAGGGRVSRTAEQHFGQTLAHEIGHYLGLYHPYDPAPRRVSPAAEQLLMHNTTASGSLIPICSRGHGPLVDNGVAEARLVASRLHRAMSAADLNNEAAVGRFRTAVRDLARRP
ncbi:MAG: hypothetical protein K2X35_13365 [Bryobacteraceae bacterium]|nr:hypothetical protein [Bryobacteraceae bacterium]